MTPNEKKTKTRVRARARAFSDGWKWICRWSFLGAFRSRGECQTPIPIIRSCSVITNPGSASRLNYSICRFPGRAPIGYAFPREITCEALRLRAALCGRSSVLRRINHRPSRATACPQYRTRAFNQGARTVRVRVLGRPPERPRCRAARSI